MCPYLSASDFVTGLPRAVGTITGSSVPLTIGEVGTIIDQMSAQLDGALQAAGYAVPIASTATQAYAQAQAIVTDGAAWKVLRVLFPNQGGTSDRMAIASEYRDDYKNAIAAIMAGQLDLVGAPVDTSEGGRQLPRSFDISHATGGGASPFFEMGTVF